MAGILSGKVVLITGAGKGLGRRLTHLCAVYGATVVAVDITPINLDPVVDELRSAGLDVHAMYHDIAKKVDVQAMVINTQSKFTRIDILINCANVNFPGNILDIDEWDLHRIFEVNAIGTLLTIQSVGRVMKHDGGGMIILAVPKNTKSTATYMASRGGFFTLAPALKNELTPFNIQVHVCGGEDPFEEISKLLQLA